MDLSYLVHDAPHHLFSNQYASLPHEHYSCGQIYRHQPFPFVFNMKPSSSTSRFDSRHSAARPSVSKARVPVADTASCTLPPISNLFGIMDGRPSDSRSIQRQRQDVDDQERRSYTHGQSVASSSSSSSPAMSVGQYSSSGNAYLSRRSSAADQFPPPALPYERSPPRTMSSYSTSGQPATAYYAAPALADAPLWQHHHYISPASAAAAYNTGSSGPGGLGGVSADRYICPTCQKAFSRPSSLRIHSHSHTGEKPFKCQHHGCGKAFSVRSNMKRHERGCHTEGGAASANSMGYAGSGSGDDADTP